MDNNYSVIDCPDCKGKGKITENILSNDFCTGIREDECKRCKGVGKLKINMEILVEFRKT